MNIEDIKQFSPKDGEKVIIIEDGKPTAVLISYEEYKKMTPIVEIPKEEEKTELTLEDLPF